MKNLVIELMSMDFKNEGVLQQEISEIKFEL